MLKCSNSCKRSQVFVPHCNFCVWMISYQLLTCILIHCTWNNHGTMCCNWYLNLYLQCLVHELLFRLEQLKYFLTQGDTKPNGWHAHVPTRLHPSNSIVIINSVQYTIAKNTTPTATQNMHENFEWLFIFSFFLFNCS